MVSPSGFVDSGKEILQVLPPDVAANVLLIVQTLGGLFVLYLVFLGIRLYWQRKQLHEIREIREDLDLVMKRLKIKKSLKENDNLRKINETLAKEYKKTVLPELFRKK